MSKNGLKRLLCSLLRQYYVRMATFLGIGNSLFSVGIPFLFCLFLRELNHMSVCPLFILIVSEVFRLFLFSWILQLSIVLRYPSSPWGVSHQFLKIYLSQCLSSLLEQNGIDQHSKRYRFQRQVYPQVCSRYSWTMCRREVSGCFQGSLLCFVCVFMCVILLSHKLSEVFFCWLCSEVRVTCSTMRNTCQLSAHSWRSYRLSKQPLPRTFR